MDMFSSELYLLTYYWLLPADAKLTIVTRHELYFNIRAVMCNIFSATLIKLVGQDIWYFWMLSLFLLAASVKHQRCGWSKNQHASECFELPHQSCVIGMFVNTEL